MTQTKMRNTIDETYKKLRNKLKTDEEITESDLLESLKLYEITNKELKKAKNKYRKWTEDEDAYLAYFAYSNDAKIQDAADYLKRTSDSVENRLSYLRKHNKATYMVRPWSEKEDEFIKKYYATVKTIQIAERLRRSPSAIKSRAWALGVKKRDGGAK
ncbi:hypothetical protein [Listeria seeligeri]|uniref:hypothetical protein n=1 Tax=Listeria seeligeri TaxID=1640 RepID=UPI0010E355EC|nr:hypothetical protein [Listeria seeligeri]EAC7449678.1 hypothetical protein [Listeria monocytogenes]MBC1815584.1 hypothetical protein [Listeria seeligeri]MBC2017008.1 hypothetical protein [Listeria seeligeri]MBF2623668.1 hypothetical protein [Listeria seeligeri]